MVKGNINQHDLFINRDVSYQSDNVITAIDIGSDKIICFIAKIDKILENKNSLYIIAEFELGGHFYSFLMK